MNCPDCGSERFEEVEAEREFTVGSKKPVALKASAPVLICQECKTELHDWRMEKSKSLAMSVWMKDHRRTFEVPENLEIGHATSSFHRKQLEHVSECGCFYCLETFNVQDIEEWIEEDQTALCPKCGIDSVIPLTENVRVEFLKEMQQFWFSVAETI